MSAKIFEIERPSGTPQLFLPLCGAEPTRAIVSVETASSKKWIASAFRIFFLTFFNNRRWSIEAIIGDGQLKHKNE